MHLANKIQSLTLHVRLRGCQAYYEMCVEDFSLNKDDQGTVYVTFEKNPNKDPARRSEKEAKSHPATNVCQWRSPGVVQSSSSKHILSTNLQKCETVPRFISLLFKNRKPKSEVWYKKQRTSVNKIDSFMKHVALEAELYAKGRKLINPSVKETLVKKLKASNQPRSLKKCYHRSV